MRSCGVILYALLCGSLPFDDESIPNLFKKIKSGMYSLPSHLSQLARNLIPRMLEVDPMKRITIGEIRVHPWFQHKLPPYLRHPPELMEKQERTIDEDVINEVSSLNFKGITRELVTRAAYCNDKDYELPKFIRDLRIAYELILDNKHTRLRIMEVAQAIKEAASATPPAFSPGASRGATPSSYGSSNMHPGSFGDATGKSPPVSQSQLIAQQQKLAEEASRALRNSAINQGPPASTVGGGGSGSNVQIHSSIPGNVGILSQQQQGRRTRRWYLGIQSKKDPAHVMTEVYKALKALDCEWLQLSNYRIQCRWFPNKTSTVKRSRDESSSDHMTMEELASSGSNGDEKDDIYKDRGATKMKIITAATNYTSSNAAVSNPGPTAPIPNLCLKKYCVKIGLTLYKVQHSIYLLDFQKINGDAFTFMTLCANIINELKTLSAASKLHQQQLLAARQAKEAEERARALGEAPESLPPPPPNAK